MEREMAPKTESTSTRITVLETQVDIITTNARKMEEKIDDNYSTLHHRISDMRDDFNKSLEDKTEKIIDKLDNQAKASTEQHKVISEKMQSFEKWRWMIMGGAIVIGYFLAHLKIDKIF